MASLFFMLLIGACLSVFSISYFIITGLKAWLKNEIIRQNGKFCSRTIIGPTGLIFTC